MIQHLNIDQSETICAIATPPGIGAIAMIRLSGPKAIKIADSVFSQNLKDKPGNTALFGLIKDNDKTVDEVVLVIYRAPHSFTGENSVEISCHASPYI